MSDPNLWYGFAGLFVFAGLLNLWRGLRSPGGMRTVRLLLSAASVAWAAAALLFRFAGTSASYAAAGVAVVLMLASGYFSLRATTRYS